MTQLGLFERKSDTERALEVLREYRDNGVQWVPNIYRLTGCMVHSRVSDLRKRGYEVEMRRFGQGDFRYRLVREPGEAQ